MTHKFSEAQLRLMLHGILNHVTPEKFEAFYQDLIHQLDRRDEIVVAVRAVLENRSHLPTIERGEEYPDISDFYHEETELQDLLNAESDFDWINCRCYFSELHSDMIDDYLNRAAYVRNDPNRDVTREILESYLDRGPVIQRHFRSLMVHLRQPETDPRAAIWHFERTMTMNHADAKTHKTFNWDM